MSLVWQDRFVLAGWVRSCWKEEVREEIQQKKMSIWVEVGLECLSWHTERNMLQANTRGEILGPSPCTRMSQILALESSYHSLSLISASPETIYSPLVDYLRQFFEHTCFATFGSLSYKTWLFPPMTANNTLWIICHLRGTENKWLMKINRLFFPCCSLELTAVDNINTAIRNCDPSKTLVALMKPEAQLPVVHSFAAVVYQTELFNLQQQNAVVRVKCLQPALWCYVAVPWNSTNKACCLVKLDLILSPWCYVLHDCFQSKWQYWVTEVISWHTLLWLSSCVATDWLF